MRVILGDASMPCYHIVLQGRGCNGRGPMSSTANVRYLKWERPFCDVGIEVAMGEQTGDAAI